MVSQKRLISSNEKTMLKTGNQSKFPLRFCSGPHRGPDHREGVVLCSGPKLRQSLLLHLQRRDDPPLDVPLLHGAQRLGKDSVLFYIRVLSVVSSARAVTGIITWRIRTGGLDPGLSLLYLLILHRTGPTAVGAGGVGKYFCFTSPDLKPDQSI